jgi:hypothetical protein
MIIVHINPAGVEKVYFQSGSELAEDLSMAVWPLVRKELDRLHKKLRKAAMTTLELAGEGERSWRRSEENGE